MVITTGNLQDVQGSVHIFKCLAEITTSMMVKGEVRVAICCLWVIIP